MKLTIIRDQWYRGKGGSGSALVTSTGMCCLGFLGKAVGYSEDEMEKQADPEVLCSAGKENLWPEGIAKRRAGRGVYHTAVGSQLITANDAVLGSEECKEFGFTDEAGREAKIASLFTEAGIEVEFE